VLLLKYGLVAGAILAAADPAQPAGVAFMGLGVEHTDSVSTIASRRPVRRQLRVNAYRNTNSDYYEHDANKLPFASRRWLEQMRRENRLGNPGG
jgi:hypothetical protein